MSSSTIEQLTQHLQDWSLSPDVPAVSHKKKALITSALPYVNNVPHMGNLIGSLLSADVFARYSRLRKRETLFVCGTDEYGTATETKALEEGLTPAEICAKYHKLHKEVYDWFNLSFDKFGRTSTPEQTELCQAIFWQLYKRELIFEESVNQLFCDSCNRFLADRFVEGICPFCSSDGARGDQCDKCGKLINAPDLKDPKCKQCSSCPRVRSSKHLFLNLPKLAPAVAEWMNETISKESCCWTQTAEVIAKAWLKEGLKPRCITRDLKWGTPVPLEGYEDKVFYVWFDAPIGYLSITKTCVGDEWVKWWKRPDEVELYQFMAKDNVPFHSIIMPATQLGTGDKYTLVDHLVAVEYLNYEDKKFSKSRGVGVFGNDAMQSGIASDIWRFYLISIRPESADSSFNWIDLMTKNNSELLNNVGNFCNRALTFLFKEFEGVVQPIQLSERDQQLIVNVNEELVVFVDLMDRAKLRDGLRQLLKISALGNLYMQETAPWTLVNPKKPDLLNKDRAGSVISLSANLVALFSVLFSPFIPATCQTLRKYLNFNEDTFCHNRMIQLLKPGHKINKPEPLFKKIEESEVKSLKIRFSGQGDDKAANKDGVALMDLTGKTVKEVADLVAEQGDKVRSLKSAKAEKDVIDKEVSVLKFLKAEQAKLTGSDVVQNSNPKKAAKK